MNIQQFNLDYKLSLLNNGLTTDLTSDTRYKFDIDVFIDKNAQFASDSFVITIRNLPRDLIDKINKPRIKVATKDKLTYVVLSLKGNNQTEYYQVLQKEALEIKSLKEENGTTYVTTISGFSGANALSFSSNINLSDITIPDLLKRISSNMGMNFVNSTTSNQFNLLDPINVQKHDFNFGEKQNIDIISKLEKSLSKKGYTMYLDNNDIILINDNKTRYNYTITQENIKKSSDIVSNIINLECFLLPQIGIYDKITIDDRTNTMTKGTYRVVSVKHDFRYRNTGETSGTTTVELLATSL